MPNCKNCLHYTYVDNGDDVDCKYQSPLDGKAFIESDEIDEALLSVCSGDIVDDVYCFYFEERPLNVGIITRRLLYPEDGYRF